MIKEQGNLTVAEGAACLPAGLRPQGGEGVGAELRAVREAARRAGSRSGTRPTAIGSRCRRLPSPREARRDGTSRTESNVGGTESRASAQGVRHRAAGGRRRELPRRGAARSWCCWGPPAAARPRRCAASPAWSIRPPAASRSAATSSRRPAQRHAGAAAAAQHRHGVPVLRGVAAHDGAPERRLSAAQPQGRRARETRPQGRRGARAGRALGLRRAAGGVALGRTDAARRAGAQPGLSAAAAAARRAAVQPRRQAAPAPARRPAPHHQADRASPRSTSRTTRPRRWCSATASASCATASCCRWRPPTSSTTARPICSSPTSPAPRTCCDGTRAASATASSAWSRPNGGSRLHGLAAGERGGGRGGQDRGAAGEHAARRQRRGRAEPLHGARRTRSAIRARRPSTSSTCWAAGSMRSSSAPACAIRSAATSSVVLPPALCWAYPASQSVEG